MDEGNGRRASKEESFIVPQPHIFSYNRARQSGSHGIILCGFSVIPIVIQVIITANENIVIQL